MSPYYVICRTCHVMIRTISNILPLHYKISLDKSKLQLLRNLCLLSEKKEKKLLLQIFPTKKKEEKKIPPMI